MANTLPNEPQPTLSAITEEIRKMLAAKFPSATVGEDHPSRYLYLITVGDSVTIEIEDNL